MSSGEGATAPGRSAVVYVDCVRYQGAFAGDVIKILSALSGLPPENIDKPGITASVSSAQPFVGKCMQIKAWNKPKKSKPGEFVTAYNYFPASEELKAKAPELRASLGLPPL